MKIKLFFFAIILSANCYSQWLPEKLITSHALLEKDSNKLTIYAEVTGFFKNNEYFSPIIKGETFPGVKIHPGITYQMDDKLKIDLGMTGIYYSGDQQKDGTYAFNGIFARLQYAINPNFHLVFGNYYDGANHRLIEPIYKWERQLTGKPESGLQLIYEDNKYFADVWLNWQRFIERGDSVPEILTFGVSSSIGVSPPGNRLQISIPFQLLIYHQGGQIDVSDEKMIVSGNLATGICSKLSLNNRIIKSIGLNAYLLGYFDKISNRKIRPYNKGWGIYPVLLADASPFKCMVGYWRANKYYSFDGEPLFASFNTDYPGISLPQRSLLTTKVSYSAQLHPTFSIGAQIETYTDLPQKRTDYSFGLYLRFNAEFLSRHINK